MTTPNVHRARRTASMMLADHMAARQRLDDAVRIVHDNGGHVPPSVEQLCHDSALDVRTTRITTRAAFARVRRIARAEDNR